MLALAVARVPQKYVIFGFLGFCQCRKTTSRIEHSAPDRVEANVSNVSATGSQIVFCGFGVIIYWRGFGYSEGGCGKFAFFFILFPLVRSPNGQRRPCFGDCRAWCGFVITCIGSFRTDGRRDLAVSVVHGPLVVSFGVQCPSGGPLWAILPAT